MLLPDRRELAVSDQVDPFAARAEVFGFATSSRRASICRR
jgi:hypothetical protein